jgi:uncharacterized protein YecE (DUF72 family)
VKFGKIAFEEKIQLSLPKFSFHTNENFQCNERIELITAGTVWNVPEWKGIHIDKKTKPSEYLSAYNTMFSAIEFNGSFYRTPSRDQVRKWRDQVNDDFLFCPKWPQSISHWRQFENCDRDLDQFFLALDAFAQNLGTSFIQLPHHFGVQKKERLISFLEQLPCDLKLAVEFRHSSWFCGTELQEIAPFFSSRNWSMIVCDTLGRRDAVHGEITSTDLIIRFGGMYGSNADESRIRSWTENYATFLKNGVKRIWIWIHQENSIKTPESAAQWLQSASELTFVQGR